MGTCTITVRSRPATETTSVADPGLAAVPHPLALVGEPEDEVGVDEVDAVDEVATPEWVLPPHELRAMAADAMVTSQPAGADL